MTEDVVKKDRFLNTVIGKCLLVKLIGKGGMGNVYLGHHQFLQKKVAVKLLPPDFTRNPEFLARFHREAIAAAKLEHPNIVQVHDVGNENDCYYIVMTYVEGRTLQEHLDSQKEPMEPKESARMCLDMARGLRAAHEQGIVHRDIKPANILVSNKGEIKITDFGLAFDVESETQLTRAGAIMGTPHFLSPEQADGRRADERSDLYSLGVVLYYMATGVKPFTGESTMSILFKHMNQAPEAPCKVNPKIPHSLQDIILKLLEKKAEKRYQNCDQLIKDLEKFASGESLPKKPGSSAVLHPRKSSVLRPPEPGSESPRLRRARPGSEPNIRKRSKTVPILLTVVAILAVAGIALAVILNSNKNGTAENKEPKTQPDVEKKDPVAELLKKAKHAEDDKRYGDALALYREALRHKDSTETREAVSRVERLMRESLDEEAWKRASELNTEKSYGEYLADYPKGKYADEANKRLKTLTPWEPEKDFRPLYTGKRDELNDFQSCAHMPGHVTPDPDQDAMILAYPNDGPGSESEAHLLWHKWYDLQDFVFRGEIMIERGKPLITGRHVTNQLYEPGRGARFDWILDEAPRMQWVQFEFQMQDEWAILSIDGKAFPKRYMHPNQSRFGTVGVGIHRGEKVRVRRLRVKILKTMDLKEVEKRFKEWKEKDEEGKEERRVAEEFAVAEKNLLLLRRPDSLREKITKLRGELKTEAGIRQLDLVEQRVDAFERVIEGFLAQCKSMMNRELEVRTKTMLRKGKISSVTDRSVTVGSFPVPLEEIHPETMADFARTAKKATSLQQALFLLLEGEGSAAMDRLIVDGNALLAGSEPFLAELVDTATAEAIRISKERNKEAQAILDRLDALGDKITPENAKKIKAARAELAKPQYEVLLNDAIQLLRKKEHKKGRDALLAIVKDPLSGGVGVEAAREIYKSILDTDNETWVSGLTARGFADWTIDEATKTAARIQSGEISLRSSGAHFGPAGIAGARGFAAEFQVIEFDGEGGVGLAWAYKDGNNLRKAVLQPKSVDSAYVESGVVKVSGQVPIESPVNKWIRLAMIEWGDSVLIFVNGTIVCRNDIKSDSFRAGGGIYVGGASVKIRNVQLLPAK